VLDRIVPHFTGGQGMPEFANCQRFPCPINSTTDEVCCDTANRPVNGLRQSCAATEVI
jgi:hypothetical protein